MKLPLKISPIFVLQLLLLLFKPPASEPADDRRPLEELSLCALGEAHIGLELATTKTNCKNNSALKIL